MKTASEFRAIARDALRGRWGLAVITGLVAVLLGGPVGDAPTVNWQINASALSADLNEAGQTIFSTDALFGSWTTGMLRSMAVFLLLAVLFFLVLGCVIGVGYSRFNLELVDRREPAFGNLFQYFPHWGNAVLTRLLKGLYIFAWTLLLVIPGIMASFSYAMSDFILAENPEMDPSQVLARSKAMMAGNRWRLFCLQFSFIGWAILCAFTLGIGNLWLRPYRSAATAAFYREVSAGYRPGCDF